MAARNRPRGGIVKEDIADELNLWNSIVEKIKRCDSAHESYQSVTGVIPTLKESLGQADTPAKAELSRVDEIQKAYREGVKLAEEELKVLNEDPDDLIRNLETLISVRAAFEVETPKPSNTLKSRNLKRRLDSDGANDSPALTPEIMTPAPAQSRAISKAVSRSGSVAAASVKSENGTAEPPEYTKALASEYGKPKFLLGAEVFYRHKGKDREGEGILCRVTNVIGDGKQRRYEIQDVDPDPEDIGQAPYRASVQSLVAIPLPADVLPDIVKGKQVLAKYPETTTFYKANFVGMKKDMCRLRFEGEDEKDKEQDVERKYVLDAK